MGWLLVKAAISAAIIVSVSEVAERYPRLGGLLLTLPVVSILAFVMAWTKSHDLPALSRLARETLVLVPLGLPFFVPLAFAQRLGLGFPSAMAIGVLLAGSTIGAWLLLGPEAK
jgi:hypothetical protein